MKHRIALSIVIPAKDEAQNVEPLLAEIAASLDGVAGFEIVYVDDGSSDGTYAELRRVAELLDCPVLPVRHKRPVGQSTAIATGVARAHGELIVTMDADRQNDPADIPAMLAEARRFAPSDDFCIAGYRKKRKDTAWKRLQSKIANAVRGKLLGDRTPDTGCGLKVLPRATFLKLPYFDHMHRFIPALVRRLGGDVVVVEVSHRDRVAGVSKYDMLGRLGVGIVDLIGVIWLQRRTRIAEVADD